MEVPRKKIKAHNFQMTHFQMNNTEGHLISAQEEGLLFEAVLEFPPPAAADAGGSPTNLHQTTGRA